MKAEEVLSHAVKIDDATFSGIYYLIQDGVIVYVGQSKNIRKRIASHIVEGKKKFDSYSFFPAEKENLNQLELDEILEHNPIYNSCLLQNDIYKNADQIKEHFGLTGMQLKKVIKFGRISPKLICGSLFYKVSEIQKELSNG